MTDIPTLSDGDVLDADLDWNAAAGAINELQTRGILDQGTATANQGSIGATETDVTGLTVTVTVVASRQLRLSAYVPIGSTVAGDRYDVRIKEGTTTLQQALGTCAVANVNSHVAAPRVYLTPSAGTHTYKVTAQRVTGTGNLTVFGDATSPADLTVEDVGPA